MYNIARAEVGNYHMAQKFDRGNIDKFLAIRQNFTIQSFLPIAVCM